MHITSSVGASYIAVVAKFPPTTATNFRALASCINSSYVLCRQRASGLFDSVYRVYFVGNDNIFMWICEEWYFTQTRRFYLCVLFVTALMSTYYSIKCKTAKERRKTYELRTAYINSNKTR